MYTCVRRMLAAAITFGKRGKLRLPASRSSAGKRVSDILHQLTTPLPVAFPLLKLLRAYLVGCERQRHAARCGRTRPASGLVRRVKGRTQAVDVRVLKRLSNGERRAAGRGCRMGRRQQWGILARTNRTVRPAPEAHDARRRLRLTPGARQRRAMHRQGNRLRGSETSDSSMPIRHSRGCRS